MNYYKSATISTYKLWIVIRENTYFGDEESALGPINKNMFDGSQ